MHNDYSLLSEWFAGMPAGNSMNIWTLNDKSSQWIDCAEDIYDSGINQNVNIYFGCASVATSAALTQYVRVTKDNATGVGGIWLDVDVMDSAHKKNTLPPDYETALKLVEEAFADKPTYVIDSGHGLQCYWLFNIWQTITDTNRDVISSVLQRWNQHFRNVSASHGYDADSTFDLARVMRLPGSRNHKNRDNVKPVIEIMQRPELRYSISHMEEVVKDVSITATKGKPEKTTTVDLGKIAEPPLEKWFDLIIQDDAALAAFKRDNPGQNDKSPSAYDMSLTQRLVRYGWSDEEIVSLLYYCRKSHNDDLKHPAYYSGTIAKVRQQIAEQSVTGTLESNMNRAEVYEKLSEEIGVPIKRLIKYCTEPSEYIIELDTEAHTRISLGGIAGLTTLKLFRNSIADAIHVLPRGMKQDNWDIIVNHLLAFLEEEKIGDETTQSGLVGSYLKEYLGREDIYDNASDAYESKGPWQKGTVIYISITHFHVWLTLRHRANLNIKDIGLAFKRLGINSQIKNVSIKHLNKRTTAQYYAVAANFVNEADNV